VFRNLSLIGPLILWAAQVAAQGVSVQSGEHETFTRLVLDIGPDRSWTLVEEADGHRLSLDPVAADYDLLDVFRTIPRERLSDLRVVDSDLILDLACDCPIRTERFQQRYLVIDVLDIPADAPRAETAPIVEPGVGLANNPRSQAELPDLMELVLSDPPAPHMNNAVRPSDPTPPPAIDIAEAALIMAEQLARATASGLLESESGRPFSDADPLGEDTPRDEGENRSAEPDNAAPMSPDLPPDWPNVPLRAETAIDAAMEQALAPQPQQNRLSCSGRPMGIADWHTGGPFGPAIGQLRRHLFDDRDRLDRNAATDLARHYLYYGFGAEARYWLTRADTAPEDLLILASLVDDTEGPRFPAISDPIICSEDELLWRYLSGALTPEMIGEEASRLQRATAALPTPLRDHLAPRIARRLAADGYPEAARNLRDMLLRGGRLPPNEVLQLDRDLGITRPGGLPAMRSAMTRAVRDDGGDPVGIMAHALAFDREVGTAPEVTHLGAAEALLREYGINPNTTALWQEVVLAHSARGDIGATLALLSLQGIAEQDRGATLTILFAERLAEGDTAGLFVLAYAHGPDWRAEGSAAGRARAGTIDHLRQAGLYSAADRLRSGQRPLILPAGPPASDAASEDVLWHSGTWADVAQQTEGVHRAIAARMDARPTGNNPEQGADPPNLARLNDRVRDSRTLREEVTRLLSAPHPGATAESDTR